MQCGYSNYPCRVSFGHHPQAHVLDHCPPIALHCLIPIQGAVSVPFTSCNEVSPHMLLGLCKHIFLSTVKSLCYMVILWGHDIPTHPLFHNTCAICTTAHSPAQVQLKPSQENLRCWYLWSRKYCKHCWDTPAAGTGTEQWRKGLHSLIV